MKYTYKNKEYTLLCEAQMKDQETRKWWNCVVYRQEETGLIFCRELIDFYYKFKLVE
jgi:hypothetical protein